MACPPEVEQPNIGMNQMLVNLDIVIGEGNSGAIALRYQAAEVSTGAAQTAWSLRPFFADAEKQATRSVFLKTYERKALEAGGLEPLLSPAARQAGPLRRRADARRPARADRRGPVGQLSWSRAARWPRPCPATSTVSRRWRCCAPWPTPSTTATTC